MVAASDILQRMIVFRRLYSSLSISIPKHHSIINSVNLGSLYSSTSLKSHSHVWAYLEDGSIYINVDEDVCGFEAVQSRMRLIEQYARNPPDKVRKIMIEQSDLQRLVIVAVKTTVAPLTILAVPAQDGASITRQNAWFYANKYHNDAVLRGLSTGRSMKWKVSNNLKESFAACLKTFMGTMVDGALRPNVRLGNGLQLSPDDHKYVRPIETIVSKDAQTSWDALPHRIQEAERPGWMTAAQKLLRETSKSQNMVHETNQYQIKSTNKSRSAHELEQREKDLMEKERALQLKEEMLNLKDAIFKLKQQLSSNGIVIGSDSGSDSGSTTPSEPSHPFSEPEDEQKSTNLDTDPKGPLEQSVIIQQQLAAAEEGGLASYRRRQLYLISQNEEKQQYAETRHGPKVTEKRKWGWRQIVS